MRPGIAIVIPGRRGPTVLIDAGANADARPEHLVQFAHMGVVFAEEILEVRDPSVRLLSIGEEPEKGNQLTLEAHELLEAADVRFDGNTEGRTLLEGDTDVVVCDGFTGNVALKTLEGTIRSILEALRAEIRIVDARTHRRPPDPPGRARPPCTARPRDDRGRLPARAAWAGRHRPWLELARRDRECDADGGPRRRASARRAARRAAARPSGPESRAAVLMRVLLSCAQSTPGQRPERFTTVALSRDEVYERVKGALVDKLGADEADINDEASFQDDLSADSLDLVELIMELEDQFGLKIPDEDAQKLTTVGQAVDYVVEHQ